MKLKELRDEIDALIASRPEAADMELMQTSCFDDPYRFETSGIYIGEAYQLDDEDDARIFNSLSAAEDEGEVEDLGDVVVIEAY